MAKPVLRKPKKKANPLKGLEYVDYKDTALLRKFISDRGKIRARRVTGVSVQQQREIAKAVTRRARVRGGRVGVRGARAPAVAAGGGGAGVGLLWGGWRRRGREGGS